jgi:hypothetical protein
MAVSPIFRQMGGEVLKAVMVFCEPLLNIPSFVDFSSKSNRRVRRWHNLGPTPFPQFDTRLLIQPYYITT